MANDALQFLMGKLWQVLREHGNLIKDADSHVETLQQDLLVLRARLSDNSGRQKETAREVDKQIRTAVYQTEDAIEYYRAQTCNSRHRNAAMRFLTAPVRVFDVSKNIDNIRKVVRRVQDLPLPAEQPATGLEEMIKSPQGVSRNKVVVGFEEEQKGIINWLLEETEVIDVFSIISMPGLGKTALAYKVFTHPTIEKAYDNSHRIWINVPHEYRTRDVLLAIASYITKVINNARERKTLMNRFFVVVDDVPNAEAWNELYEILSKFKLCKILITTQLEEVACSLNIIRNPLRLRLLTSEECWQLLQSEVFGNSICPSELEPFGQIIAKKCGGLPLFIVMIGKVLTSRLLYGGMLDKQHAWENVSANLCCFLDAKAFPHSNTSFYYRLPYHLMQCFVYTGMFPEGFEISVRTLIRLWRAEGFICREANASLDETACRYLDDLINRNLVKIGNRGLDGQVKTCRVHCFLWAFCIKEASGDRLNIFQHMKYMGHKRFDPPVSNIKEDRRLCFDSNLNDFFSLGPRCPSVHSLVCFCRDDLKHASISSIPEVLKYLRILETKLITVNTLPKGWDKLALLRCVVLSINFEVIPKVISKLLNMQIFIVYTTSGELEIKANVWKMSQLRHIETNVPTKLPNPINNEHDNQLETLGMISHQSCTDHVFNRLRRLRKLGIRGQLETLLVKANGLDALEELEKLKLMNDLSANAPTSDGAPSLCTFPSNLRSLTLSATNLEWSHMSILGALNKLEVLKLKNNAFKGCLWPASAGGFYKLQILHIVEHNQLVTWEASVNSFPILRCFMLTNCTRLEEIPLRLGDSLQKLYLKGHPEHSSVVASARRIKQMNNGLLLEIIS